MPVKKKETSATSSRSSKKKEDGKKMSTLQRTICRNIIDSADVTKSQVGNTLVEKLSASGTSREDMKDILKIVSSVIDTQSNQLIDRVVKEFE